MQSPKSSLNLIGISGRPGSGRCTAAKMIETIQPGHNWQIKKYTAYIEEIISKVTGIPITDLDDDDVKNSYLSQDWSYIREERFVDAGGINRKPVRYYLTPAAMMKRLDIEVSRQVHSNFLVNALFVDWKPEDRWIVHDVWFPNEAECLKERGGILIKIHRKGESRVGRSSEYPLEKWPFDYTIDNNGSLADLKKKLEKITLDFSNSNHITTV